jgi:hypothetical protein
MEPYSKKIKSEKLGISRSTKLQSSNHRIYHLYEDLGQGILHRHEIPRSFYCQQQLLFGMQTEFRRPGGFLNLFPFAMTLWPNFQKQATETLGMQFLSVFITVSEGRLVMQESITETVQPEEPTSNIACCMHDARNLAKRWLPIQGVIRWWELWSNFSGIFDTERIEIWPLLVPGVMRSLVE